MKIYFSISFVCSLSLEELAQRIGLAPFEYDAENEDEWVLGSVGGFTDIDIARTHLVAPGETRTSIVRYAHPDREIPASLIQSFHAALKEVAVEFQVHGSEDGRPFHEAWSEASSV